jgi:predicted ester cyclase
LYSDFKHQPISQITLFKGENIMPAEQTNNVVLTMIEAFNARQFDALAGTIVSPDLIYTQNGNTGDRNKWLQDFRNCVVSFPDVRLTVKSQEIVGDQVITDLAISGTHLGPLGEIAPTGKSFNVGSHVTCHVKDGIMVDWIEQVDEMGMARQLGLIPGEVTETIANR